MQTELELAAANAKLDAVAEALSFMRTLQDHAREQCQMHSDAGDIEALNTAGNLYTGLMMGVTAIECALEE